MSEIRFLLKDICTNYHISTGVLHKQITNLFGEDSISVNQLYDYNSGKYMPSWNALSQILIALKEETDPDLTFESLFDFNNKISKAGECPSNIENLTAYNLTREGYFSQAIGIYSKLIEKLHEKTKTIVDRKKLLLQKMSNVNKKEEITLCIEKEKKSCKEKEEKLLYRQAQCYISLGELEKAETLLNSVLEEHYNENNPVSSLIISCLLAMSSIKRKKGKLTESYELCTKATRFLEKLPPNTLVPQTLWAQAWRLQAEVRRTEGWITGALPLLEFAKYHIKNPQSRGEKLATAHINNTLGLVYTSLDQLNKAVNYHKKAHKIRKRYGTKYDCALTAKDIAKIGVWKSRSLNKSKREKTLQKSLKTFNKARDVFIHSESKSELGRCYKGIGDLHYCRYHMDGDPLINTEDDENLFLAKENYKWSLELFEQTGEILKVSYVKLRLGLVYQKLGKIEKALNLYLEVINIFESRKNESSMELPTDRQALRAAYNRLGRLLFKHKKDLEGAEKEYQKAKNLYQAPTHPRFHEIVIKNEENPIIFDRGDRHYAYTLMGITEILIEKKGRDNLDLADMYLAATLTIFPSNEKQDKGYSYLYLSKINFLQRKQSRVKHRLAKIYLAWAEDQFKSLDYKRGLVKVQKLKEEFA